MSQGSQVPSFSQVACIGSGLSAIGLGATLKRWYGLDNIRFFERHSESGGTWWINTYPGCACDVPGALYSYSFEPNPNWTKLMPSQAEIKAYQDKIIAKYGLREKTAFSTEVLRCEWSGESSLWTLFLHDTVTGRQYMHQCQVLFSAAGQLVEPRPCDVPGHESFRGEIFHSARWNHDVSLAGKNVVIIGNGCTAAQIVPAIAPEVKHLTQIVRSQHWVFESVNFRYGNITQWAFRHIPFALRLHRFYIFLIAESDFPLFFMNRAAALLRAYKRKNVERYMRERAPAKYHDVLVPDFDIGCKRRIFDAGYLSSLHHENLTLTDDKICEIVPDGIKTDKGFIPADVIVLATGFRTNEFLQKMQIVGKGGETIQEHWSKHPGPGAYNCSVLSGFPNFFMLLGPNSATGHTSSLMAAEKYWHCYYFFKVNAQLTPFGSSINYALRILKPVFKGKARSVEIDSKAEHTYIHKLQDALQTRVWNAGCSSWYSNEKNWNAMSYPWSQTHYWFRSLFPVWADWKIKKSPTLCNSAYRYLFLVALAVAASACIVGKLDIGSTVPELAKLKQVLRL